MCESTKATAFLLPTGVDSNTSARGNQMGKIWIYDLCFMVHWATCPFFTLRRYMT